MSLEDVDTGDLSDSGGAPLSDTYSEQQLLGLMLTTPAKMTEVIDIVSPRDFFVPVHRTLYESLTRAYDDGLTVPEILRSLGSVPVMDGLTTQQYAARLMVDADAMLDPAEVADRLQQIGERRAVATAEDYQAEFTSKFGGKRWEEIGDGSTPGYEWVVEDVIPMAEAIMMFGDSGTGKSFVAFDMSMHIARGLPYFGHNVERGLVIYVAAEGARGFAKRKKAYSLYHKLADDAAFPFYLMTRRPDFFSSDADCLALIEEVRAVARTYGAKLVLVVLDTLSALAPGMNENASADVSAVRRRVVRIVEELGVSVILVHHKPKNGSTPRGHGSMTADYESTIELEVTEKRTIEGKEVFRSTARKQRDGKKGISWEFCLPVFEVGTNKWGNPETSCVAVPFKSTVTNLSGFHAKPNELLFLKALYAALDDHGQPPPAGLPQSIVKAVELKHVRAAMRERYIDKDADSTTADNSFRSAFKRAGDALRDGAVIGVASGIIWPTGKPVRGFSTSEQVVT